MNTKTFIISWLVMHLIFNAEAEISFNSGLTGTWHDELVPGQGLIIEIIPRNQQLFAGWFTFNPFGEPVDQPHWLSLHGHYSGSLAQVILLETTQGVFVTPSETSFTDQGYASLTALSCTELLYEYVLSAGGKSGSINLTRATPDVHCAEQLDDPVETSPFNYPPTVTLTNTTVDETHIHLVFDATDPERDQLELRFRVHGPDGQTHDIALPYLIGHVGHPVVSGQQQRVSWAYSRDLQLQELGWTALQVEIIADDHYSSTTQSIVDSVSEARIISDIQALEGIRHHQTNPLGLAQARQYIIGQMSNHPLTLEEQTFMHQGSEGVNIIGILAADLPVEDTFIIDGHYDTVSRTPGADDNASGTAGMLEAMRVLSQFNTRANIRFIAFDKEELGLVGSRHYARIKPADEQITGLINFEMIGYTCSAQPECVNFPNADTSIYNIMSAFASRMGNTFQQIGQNHVPGLKITSVTDDGDANFRRSDHAPFWDLGVDALFLTDGANFRTPHYHQTSDRLHTLDTTFATRVVQTAVGTIASLAGVHHTGSDITAVIDLNGEN
ncbi:M28 family metallopeptidase [Marinicella sediminis]|uniref:M28 family metallopeptidase n=1 Tax=Marinicella sediminis TaxID=1792834 RepID=A0ABV7J8P3_9GAMM|nr:M28 family peptidase [Marinicella sediminis]